MGHNKHIFAIKGESVCPSYLSKLSGVLIVLGTMEQVGITSKKMPFGGSEHPPTRPSV